MSGSRIWHVLLRTLSWGEIGFGSLLFGLAVLGGWSFVQAALAIQAENGWVCGMPMVVMIMMGGLGLGFLSGGLALRSKTLALRWLGRLPLLFAPYFPFALLWAYMVCSPAPSS